VSWRVLVGCVETPCDGQMGEAGGRGMEASERV